VYSLSAASAQLEDLKNSISNRASSKAGLGLGLASNIDPLVEADYGLLTFLFTTFSYLSANAYTFYLVPNILSPASPSPGRIYPISLSFSSNEAVTIGTSG